MQLTYRGVGVLVVTYDYGNGAMQVTQSNLDAGVLWSMAKGVMDTAHNTVVAVAKPSNE